MAPVAVEEVVLEEAVEAVAAEGAAGVNRDGADLDYTGQNDNHAVFRIES